MTFIATKGRRMVKVRTVLNVEKLIITEKSNAFMDVAKKYLILIYKNIDAKELLKNYLRYMKTSHQWKTIIGSIAF
jgi:hypothetical protein